MGLQLQGCNEDFGAGAHTARALRGKLLVICVFLPSSVVACVYRVNTTERIKNCSGSVLKDINLGLHLLIFLGGVGAQSAENLISVG